MKGFGNLPAWVGQHEKRRVDWFATYSAVFPQECPLGDADWMIKTANELGLGSTVRQRGRPKKEPPAPLSQYLQIWWL